MMYSDSIEDYRLFFFNCWQKNRANEPLEEIEKIIADIIKEHSEYLSFFESPDKILQAPANSDLQSPFLHISLHLAVREQIAANQPIGIKTLYNTLFTATMGDWHGVEHIMMEALAESMFAQGGRGGFDANNYFDRIRQLANIK